MRLKRRSKTDGVTIFAYIFLAVASVIFLFPMFAAIMVSVSSEESILYNGYMLIPESFSLDAYKLLFTNYGESLARALVLTIGTGILQPLISVFLTMCMAYPLSQPDFAGRNFWRKFLVVTMLFSGGLIPTYILYTKYLNLKNTVLVYLVPSVTAWNVFLFRTFFVNIDKSLIESAKLDGANKLQILLKVMLPLTKPLVAMNFFSGFLGRWNDISIPLYYITDRKLFTVQYLLQEMIRSSESAKKLMEMGMTATSTLPDIPIESTRFALAVIGAIPVLILFPFLQKYYAKGIMVGSTKG